MKHIFAEQCFRQNVAGRIQTQLNENLCFRIRLHCCLSKPTKKIASVNVLPPVLPSLGGEMI